MNQELNRYTLIAYKSSSVDSCRGCVMNTYSSDLIILNSFNINDIINKIAECNSDIELKDRSGECDYEYTIYKNGIDLTNQTNLTDDEYYTDGFTEELLKEYNHIVNSAKEKSNSLIKFEQEKIKKENDEKLEKKQREKIEEEKRLLDRLKKKYET